MTDMTTSLADLRSQIANAMRGDQYRLRNSLKRIEERHRNNEPFDRSLTKLQDQLTKSVEKRAKRLAGVPKVEYDDALPVSLRRTEIADAIRDHQVVVVCGETGSGKSTQIPKICLELGRGIDGMIGHTQPRRLAARTIAERVSDELKRPLGDAVGFKIRFTDTTRPHTYIKLMTDGILLAESNSDRFLDQYDTIIIDEAHERSLNIDFLLGYIKRILKRRPDLRVIITSATIDADRFAEFFKVGETAVPIIQVAGKTYPVELRYRPVISEDDGDDIDWQQATADACVELSREGTGDILVFMPTERDIRETARVLNGRSFPGPPTEVLPLFGRLSEKEQKKVFKSHSGRRIVIATNVAESSLTVPGIEYVVDPGTARMSRYSATSKVQRLPIEPISQASANQRMGRCGRVKPGVCVRLYSKQDFDSRDAYTQPEIQRTNLASVLLTMKTLKLGRLEDFPFLDPPAPTSVRSAMKTLFELGAIDEREELTDIGKSMGRLPVDPRIARMILAAADEQCLEEVLIIAAALEQRDPRDRPLDKQQAADTAHQKFAHETSDFLSLLKLWDFFAEQEKKLSNSKLRKASQQNFLSFNRMREWRDLHRQLRDLVTERGIKPTDRRNDEDAIHRAILTGTLSNIAQRGESHEYTGSGGQKLFLWPGSVAFSGKPKWMVAAELVETSKRYARCVAPVQPIWIERIASHLLKRTYSDPHWHEKSSSAMAFEKVTLFGLPIVPRRRCRYGHVDAKVARQLFIQHALVQGEYVSPGPFQQHNEKLKSELDEWQAKLRQGSNFVGEEAEFNFYDDRIPPDVFDGPRFEKWRNSAEIRTPKILHLTREDLLVDPDAAPHQTAFPDELKVGTMQLPVEYNLEPGAKNDGVTLVVPREGLNQLSNENLAWLVPGLLEEKVAALIKTLPKALRILFVPVPETARSLTHTLRYGRGDLLEQLSSQLRTMSGEYVPVSAFELSRVPEHLQFNVRIIDPSGKVLAEGRDLNQVRRLADKQAQSTLSQVSDEQWTKIGITSWNFGSLPEEVTLQRRGVTVVGYPTLIDETKSIRLSLADSKAEADWQTRRALIRLLWFRDHQKYTQQVKHFPGIRQLSVQASSLPDGKFFEMQLAYFMAAESLFAVNSIPRTEQEWNKRTKHAAAQVSLVVQDLADVMDSVLVEYHKTRRLLEKKHPPALAPLLADLKSQLDGIINSGFLIHTPMNWLKQFPRYFEAMRFRWKKGTEGGFQKDRKQQQLITPHLARYAQAARTYGTSVRQRPRLVQYRWCIEEYRVSLFAQQLKTAVSVSEKRLNQLWDDIVQTNGN